MKSIFIVTICIITSFSVWAGDTYLYYPVQRDAPYADIERKNLKDDIAKDKYPQQFPSRDEKLWIYNQEDMKNTNATENCTHDRNAIQKELDNYIKDEMVN